ncbi:MAG: ABC transporter permease [Betaproteobacteria bacterium]|nr:ABC transporter permease [Betaproteobacteria bacterium]
MLRFIAWRLGRAALTVLLVLVGCFVAIRSAGSPVDILYPEDATPEQTALLEKQWGLDRSLPEQFGLYVANLARGDFGVSIIERRPVTHIYAEKLQPTLQLAGLALLIGVCVGIPLGAIAALRRGRAAARAAMALAFTGYAVPHFIIAIVLILIFSYHLNWLPSTGAASAWHYVLPAVTLALPLIAAIARYMRSTMLDVMNQDYVRTARAKGVAEPRVVTLHVMRNALLPLITVLGLEVAGLINGSLIVETVFSWPGLGKVLTGSVSRRDFPVLQFGVIAYAIAVVSINCLVDVLYAVADPRVRVES